MPRGSYRGELVISVINYVCNPRAGGERSPEGLPEGRNEDASGAPEMRLDGSGVRFPAGERRTV